MSKRCYFRKGHWRNYKTGKSVWIKEIIVNETDYYKKHTESPRTHYNRMTGSNVKFSTLYSYVGSKAVFYKETQFYWKEKIDNKRVNKIIVPFFGGGSDFTSIAVKAHKKVKTMVVNDLNPSICGVMNNIRDNREALKEAVLELADINFSDEDEKGDYLRLLAEEANKLEMEGQYDDITLSAYFIILLNNSHGGQYQFINEKFSRFTFGKHNDSKRSFQLNGENLTQRIDFFGFFVDKFENFEVENMDYEALIEKHSNENTLIVADPLYVEECLEEVDNKKLKKCSVDYGFKNFDHDRCTRVFTGALKGAQLIYHNNRNVILLKKFKNKEKFGFAFIDKKSPERNKEGEVRNSYEMIIFSDKHMVMQGYVLSNNANYNPRIFKLA
jgi:hypothetical protein